MNAKAVVVFAVLAALSGCSSVPKGDRVGMRGVVGVADPAVRAMEQQRQRDVLAQLDWGFSGRVAVTNGRDGGNGRLDWQQNGRGFTVRLSAPVTRQGWELSVERDTGLARLDGLSGGTRWGEDARSLVLEATGWDLPVETLGDWVRGVIGPQAHLLAEDATGRPVRVEQDGWRVDFSQWYEAEDGRPVLPRRVDAVNGDSRVRLLVDQWSGWEL